MKCGICHGPLPAGRVLLCSDQCRGTVVDFFRDVNSLMESWPVGPEGPGQEWSVGELREWWRIEGSIIDALLATIERGRWSAQALDQLLVMDAADRGPRWRYLSVAELAGREAPAHNRGVRTRSIMNVTAAVYDSQERFKPFADDVPVGCGGGHLELQNTVDAEPKKFPAQASSGILAGRGGRSRPRRALRLSLCALPRAFPKGIPNDVG